ncbi:MAG: glutamate--tRNA ligase [Spirochaetales bacterium]|nr:glutamate--tRNA ligase [Spirochaetales bacterium]
MSENTIRVRYAPSPTGYQHIGGVRTALFNYLFARATGGKFILRIEDTDQERFTKDALEDIYTTFSWLGMDWDEGPDKEGPFAPYFQSQRTELYKKHIMDLVDRGEAYYCYCSSERLEAMREEQQKTKKGSGYDRRCRELSGVELEKAKAENPNPVVRLKIPLNGETSFDDILLGSVKRKNTDINPDPVILKSDGFPTYHLANVVDDHTMEITHILRAQEWVPSVPIHVILYKAFGWEPPKFCHLPMVMGKDGQKLSKRHGSTSLRDFKTEGYLKEAILNYIALLGWSFDDTREFFTLAELEKLFTIDKLNKSASTFDYKKLEWFNGQYIRQKSKDEVKNLILPYLKEDEKVAAVIDSDKGGEILDGVISLVHERLKLLKDVLPLTRFLFVDEVDFETEELIPKKMDALAAIKICEKIKELFGRFSDSDEENEAFFRAAADELGVKLGDLLQPLRVAITGSKVSPPLFESLGLLGMEKCIKRLNKAIDQLKA